MSDKVTIDREIFEEVLRIARDNTEVAYNYYLASHKGFTRASVIQSFEDELATIEAARKVVG